MQNPSRRSFLGGMGMVAGSGLPTTLGATEASFPSRSGSGQEDLYSSVPASVPWQHPEAREWDAMTFESWLNSRLKTKVARQFLTLMTNQAYSAEPGEISLLQMLWFLKTSHGLPGWALGGPQASRTCPPTFTSRSMGSRRA
ncbi:MAG: hypothetical protein ACHRXM_18825 [Isosphaerales bacterium]